MIMLCGSTPSKAEGNTPAAKATVPLNTTKKPSKDKKKIRQCTYDVTLRRVGITIFAVEKQ
jgi:hypothetical protein